MEKTLQALYDEATVKAGRVAQAMNEHAAKKELTEVKKAAKNAMDKYNGELAKQTYIKWAETGNAIETAIRTYWLPDAKRVTYKTDEDTNYTTVEISDAKIPVNLPTMHTVLGEDKFASANWFDRCQKLAFIVANALNKNLGDSPAFQYVVTEAARAFNFSEDAKPDSVSSMCKALQNVADAILFIPVEDKKGNTVNQIKMDSRAWHFISNAMTREGKGIGAIEVVGTAKMSDLVMQAMNRIITNDKFSVEQSK